jgi:hypothetical protein
MMKSRHGRKLAMFIVLVSLLCAGAVAQEVAISSASDVQMNATADLDLTIQHSDKDLGALDIVLVYEPSVMEVCRFEANAQKWMLMETDLQLGSARIGLLPLGGGTVDARSPVSVGHFVVESMNNDGSQTSLGLVLNVITDGNGNTITNEFASGIKNGSFSTRDQTKPVITIDSPRPDATVSQDIMVNATITDVGGVNPDSIKVCVGSTEVNFDKTAIPHGYIVNATHTVQNMGPVRDLHRGIGQFHSSEQQQLCNKR